MLVEVLVVVVVGGVVVVVVVLVVVGGTVVVLVVVLVVLVVVVVASQASQSVALTAVLADVTSADLACPLVTNQTVAPTTYAPKLPKKLIVLQNVAPES